MSVAKFQSGWVTKSYLINRKEAAAVKGFRQVPLQKSNKVSGKTQDKRTLSKLLKRKSEVEIPFWFRLQLALTRLRRDRYSVMRFDVIIQDGDEFGDDGVAFEGEQESAVGVDGRFGLFKRSG